MLQRQLARLGLRADQAPSPEGWGRVLERVDAHYRSMDQDRYLLERAMDVSSDELRELTREAQEERARLDAIVESLPEAVLAIDVQGCLVHHNRAASRLLGVTPDRVGQPITDWLQFAAPGARLAPNDASNAESAGAAPRSASLSADTLVEHVAARRAAAVDDGWAGPVGGPTFAAGLRLSPADGVRTAAVLTITDLTESRAQQAALRRAQVEAEVSRRTEQARGRFLANVSHELRTPLNVVMGYSELLLDDVTGAVADDVRRIHVSALQLLALIDDILDLSKVDAGKMEAVLEPVDLVALAREVVEAMTPVVALRGNELALDLPDGSAWLRTDRVKLRQCLFNLVSNATRFTERGTLSVGVIPGAGEVRLRVTDTGVGIDEEHLSRLFEPFEQAGPDTARAHGGTGLGLAIVRAVVELLGGRVEVRSRRGSGSTFDLVFPVTE